MGLTIKINFRGAFNSNSFKSATRIVARNEKGQVLASCSTIHENIPSSFVTEATACLHAVHIGLSKGWTDVKIEGDVLVIIKNANLLDKSQLHAYIHDIQQLKGSFQHIC